MYSEFGHILQVLDIIDYQSVDTLVEVEEIVDILGCCCGILALEESSCHIKNACLGVALLNSYADSLNEVSLSDTRRTENEKRVEGLERRIVCYSLANRTCDFIAVALAVVLKCVAGIELRVEVALAYGANGLAAVHCFEP